MWNNNHWYYLVDDEEDLCTLMQMSLMRMGIRTHIAHRLEDAKNAWQIISMMPALRT